MNVTSVTSVSSTSWLITEIFYLTTHSTHFIYRYMASDIWLRTTQIVREETRCGHMGYSFQHWLEQEIAQWVQPMKDRSDDPSHHERTLLPRSYILLLWLINNGIYLTAYSGWLSNRIVNTSDQTRWNLVE